MVVDRLKSSIEVKEKIIKDSKLIEKIILSSEKIIECYKKGGKLLFAGNGGSAADAQHLAAELVVRFYLNRKALKALALNTNTSILTATANDFDFTQIFSRQIEANGDKGDIFIGFSTSGNSPNIIEAIKTAKEKELFIIGFTGETGGKMKEMCDILINVPSNDTPRIQEAHITIGHIICEIVERKLFENV